jgi:hypothetical protein
MLTQKQVLKDGAVLIFLPGIRHIRELQVVVHSFLFPSTFNIVLRSFVKNFIQDRLQFSREFGQVNTHDSSMTICVIYHFSNGKYHQFFAGQEVQSFGCTFICFTRGSSSNI